jgi:TatD DNase family protein
MIDCHTHLESPEYNSDRGAVIERCKSAGLKAVITSCANPSDWNLTMELVKKHTGFVFACAAIHPEYVKEISDEDIEKFIEIISSNDDSLVGIGETGLDYNWVKEPEWREKQAELFRRFIALSKDLHKPLVIHARDAYDQVVQILEQEGAKNVMLHMFGANQLVKRVIDNGWRISLNAIVLRSKKHQKVARDVPLDKLMLETDAPWLHPDGKIRNEPSSIKAVAEKIAEIKKLSFDEIWKTSGLNAVQMFGLPVEVE